MSGLASYRVDEVLKRGAAETTEVVYLPAPSGGEAGPFVLKRLRREARMGAAYTTLLRAERSGARLRHLPRIFSVAEVGEETHVIMELVPGETLAELTRRVGPSPALARALMPLVCEGVAELHEGFPAPIIHRDLKPSNIMVEGWDDGPAPAGRLRVTIIDLGIARSWHADGSADTTHLGTRGYAPPEQFGFGQTDVRSDVYALGVLLAFCCTGEDPVSERTAAGLGALGMPEPLAAVAAKAMSFDPADRFASAAELAAAIAAAAPTREDAAASRVVAGPASPTPAGPSWLPRLRSSPLLVRISAVLGVLWNLALIFLAAILVAASYWSVVDPRDPLVGGPLFRALSAILVLDIPGAAAFWLLFDKRRLSRLVPAAGRWTWRRCLLLTVKACIACFAGMVVLVIAQMILGRF